MGKIPVMIMLGCVLFTGPFMDFVAYFTLARAELYCAIRSSVKSISSDAFLDLTNLG